MGLCKGLPVISVVILYLSWLPLPIHVQSFHQYNQVGGLSSLDVFINEYANRQQVKPRTGSLYNITLPANFSGIEVSVVIFRSGSFWFRGANFSFIKIPPRAISQPYVKRLAVVYENLGNRSSQFYSVPGYSLVAPVIGFRAYESSESRTISNNKLNVSALGDPIAVRFPQVQVRGKRETARCVNFLDGSVHFRNLTEANLCISDREGHFSIVVPAEPSSSRKRQRYLFWWVIGFGVGLVGLVLFASCVLVISKLVKQRRIEKMEKRSEKSEAFDTFWVGASKMPSAPMIRTQPVLEQNHLA